MRTENKVDNNDESTEEILHIEDIVAIIMVFNYQYVCVSLTCKLKT